MKGRDERLLNHQVKQGDNPLRQVESLEAHRPCERIRAVRDASKGGGPGGSEQQLLRSGGEVGEGRERREGGDVTAPLREQLRHPLCHRVVGYVAPGGLRGARARV